MNATLLTILVTLAVAILLPVYGVVQSRRSARQIDRLRTDDVRPATVQAGLGRR